MVQLVSTHLIPYRFNVCSQVRNFQAAVRCVSDLLPDQLITGTWDGEPNIIPEAVVVINVVLMEQLMVSLAFDL